ncbi:ABC transporter ATP-binding protein [Leadbettera azotonutricia]|uniref:Aliphatic sulfonates import ATP-binding protein SsuB n=1 Tax=Leadbettera azotonutricia (strain ATCC BAA-888 / DSM 13862 / ZAS-9) TaxID=545695 RepID=F5YDF3_LEAAZ|nr:ABC transporter ATP-binding protein [Leadbettera azotonutricia]AEF80525.1 aliphatic sulfonates import ATP-binding protein SsuB [Leadbettera azotonutricia ZAS-9]
MIEAKSITKFFSVVNEKGLAEGLTAVLNVSITIPDGKIVTLLGPSGCGKSTFLEILAGLQAPTDGEIRIDGKRVLEPLPSTRKEMEDYKRRYRFISPLANGVFRDRPKHDIAMIFQDYAIFPWMTAVENINFALKLRGIKRQERNERSRYYLGKVGLSGVEYKYPSQLSGGMRQRLALARALSVEPKIILMDEPFAAVDALTREKLQDDLLRLWEETKSSLIIVMVTHDVSEAVYLSDEVVVFSPSPGTIRNRIPVDIKRPRARTDQDVVEIQERIFAMFQYDLNQESEYSI